MPKRVPPMAILGLVAVLAACDTSVQEEFVITEPEPITIDKAFSGKY